jgi:hypothetical protein
MIAGTALFALAACYSHRSAAPSSATGLRETTGPIQATDKVFRDDGGNTVKIRLDRSDIAKAQVLSVTGTDGKALEIRDYALRDIILCPPDPVAPSASSGAQALKRPCERAERASSVSEDAFIKFGTASCYCYTVFQGLKCWGNTCP